MSELSSLICHIINCGMTDQTLSFLYNHRSNKERPRTAPDRVTVANMHRTAKGRKPSLTGGESICAVKLFIGVPSL